MSKTAFQLVLEKIESSFDTVTRPNGEEIVTIADSAPEWVQNIAMECHGGMMPDDWRYYMLERVVIALCERQPEDLDAAEDEVTEISDELASDYYHELTGWLHSRADRLGYCDDVIADFAGTGVSMNQILQLGQAQEYREIADMLIREADDMADDCHPWLVGVSLVGCLPHNVMTFQRHSDAVSALEPILLEDAALAEENGNSELYETLTEQASRVVDSDDPIDVVAGGYHYWISENPEPFEHDD